jgi:hypothetical protein
MTDRAWTGAVNDDARNPGNWSPNGAPEPGDTLKDPLNNSTMAITRNALQGDTLSILDFVSGATLNLSKHADMNLELGPGSQVVANVDGHDTLNVTLNGSGFMAQLAATLTENLGAHSNLAGSFNATFSSLTISGAEHTRYHNNGTDTLTAGRVAIDVDVVGSGTFVLGPGSTRVTDVGSKLEFGGLVAGGQTVQVSGGPSFGGPSFAGDAGISTLQIDEPRQFHGTVDLHDFGLTDLVGLAQADSWSYTNDMLSIFNGCGKVLDTLHIISDASSTGSIHGLTVSKTIAGDVLVSPGTAFDGSLTAPTT